jgi:hypothetical protein
MTARYNTARGEQPERQAEQDIQNRTVRTGERQNMTGRIG